MVFTVIPSPENQCNTRVIHHNAARKLQNHAIASSGRATVLNLRDSVPGEPLVAHRRWVQPFDQVIPQPFCAPGPNAFLYVVGPVLDQHVELTSAGTYVSHFHAAGRLQVTPTDPTTGQAIAATYEAVVVKTHEGILSAADASAGFSTRRILLPPSAPGRGTFEFIFAVAPGGDTLTRTTVGCGSDHRAGGAAERRW